MSTDKNPDMKTLVALTVNCKIMIITIPITCTSFSSFIIHQGRIFTATISINDRKLSWYKNDDLQSAVFIVVELRSI